MASFFGMLWKSDEDTVQTECDDVPAPPAQPVEKKPKADVAMNCIRHYIVTRNRRIRELVVYLKERITDELRDQTLHFGRSEININLETIVGVSDEYSDDFSGDNHLVEKEWANIQDELSEHFTNLGLKYKTENGNVHICVTIPPQPAADAGPSECPELLTKLWNNLKSYAEKRERDIDTYCDDLVDYIFEQICHVARTRGDNDILVDLEKVYTLMPKWEKVWSGAHGLLHTEQKKITAHLRDVMLAEGFDVQDFPWKFKMSFTWNYPSCIWRYSDREGAWTKM